MSEPLPDLLSRIAAAAGEDAARLVAKEWGGRLLYVPEKLTPDHRLVQVLGERRAQLVHEILPPREQVLVPMGDFAGPAARRRAASELLDRNKSWGEAAAATGVHIRTVGRVAKKRRDRRQGKLDL